MMPTKNISQRLQKKKKRFHLINIQAREEQAAGKERSRSSSKADDEALENTRHISFFNENWEDIRNQTQNIAKARCDPLTRKTKTTKANHQGRSGKNIEEIGET